ncbi:MAG: PPC domain-containing DNA-binding protein [Syntrophorhabdales bacterium]|jgi:predicted DNA-binding protein with PD1-like motif
MRYSEARQGRVFVIRLEDGDVLHESIEAFAREHGIQAAGLIALGGADSASRLVVGPEEGRSSPIIPMEQALRDVHEVAGVGTLFPNAEGQPVLHMHVAAGRGGKAITGCVRMGVRIWHVLEVVLWELTGTKAVRVLDPETGFELLKP